MIVINGIDKPGSCKNCKFAGLICDERNMETCPIVAVEPDESSVKCESNVKITLDGENYVDPCQYEIIDRRENCVVEVLRCTKCGHIEVFWTDRDKHPDWVDEE